MPRGYDRENTRRGNRPGKTRGLLPAYMTRWPVVEPSQWQKLLWRLRMNEDQALAAIQTGKCKILTDWVRKYWGAIYVPEQAGILLGLKLDYCRERPLR